MGGAEPPADPELPTQEQTEKDNYVIMLYKSRNIAAVRESRGSKKQVLEARFKNSNFKISSNTF
jgi:hypothetical protein